VEVQIMVFEIECPECEISRRVEDNEQAVRELAEIHEQELGHDVTISGVADD
jgi:hypothetical protein